jgi:hypothetical protein
MEYELRCRIVLETPPAGVDFAIQIGQGAKFQLGQKQRSTGDDLEFEFSVIVAATAQSAPDFRGPAVQGPRGQRFIYINSGTYAGQSRTAWSRRLKVPLVGLSSETVSRAAANPRGVLEARVAGTARDGGPNCATVKPFSGWVLKA